MGNFFRKKENIYLIFAGICGLTILGMRYLVPLFMPFLLAFFFVAALYPTLCRLQKKTHLGKSFWAGVVLLFLILILGGVLWYISGRIFYQAGNILINMEEIQDTLYLFIRTCCDKLEVQMGIGADTMETFILDRVNIMMENVQMEIAPRIMGESVTYAKTLISLVACAAVTFIAVILLTKDYDRIMAWADRQRGFREAFCIVKKVAGLIVAFAKAQMIILLIISIIVSTGFFLLKIDNPFGLGFLTGFLDMLPFIGTGIVLIPFALFSFMEGEIAKAVGCLAIYLICALAREFLEPKLIGKKMGIYPVGMLLSIYVGIKLYGLAGIILGPVTVLLILEIMKRIKAIAFPVELE